MCVLLSHYCLVEMKKKLPPSDEDNDESVECWWQKEEEKLESEFNGE